jgi:phosphoribosylformimino-5-aminoimidazole carboxamide ribotide isomerase
MNTSTSFTIFPAIDLRGGQVVRLKEGDPNRQTSYSSDPAAIARRWIAAGTRYLHVVNLDGAFGEIANANLAALKAILSVARPAGVPVQFGGGLRTMANIQAVLDQGVTRAVLGTIVVEQPQVLSEALSCWGQERIAVSLDAREGRVQVRGWQNATPLLAVDLACSLNQSGLRWLVFTDIARDGLQTGLNLPATIELAVKSGLDVIASGGVNSLEDVRQARDAGLSGAIVGRALYESAIDPAQLFAFNTHP